MPAPPPGPALDWVADRCLRVRWGDEASPEVSRRVHAAAACLQEPRLPGLLDLTPAYTSLLLTFDLSRLDAEALERQVRDRLARPGLASGAPGRLVHVPTCCEGDCACDLAEVARLTGLAAPEVLAEHHRPTYVVAFLGFAPGFPYLLGLVASLWVPRRERPRARVPAGSVGIAGRQAGIYPSPTPGGWRILGCTPLRLFEADRGEPALLRPGDQVRFDPIDHAQHLALLAGDR